MKQLATLLIFIISFTACKNENRENREYDSQVTEASEKVESERDSANVEIQPISHATAVVNWGDFVFYLDPTGGAEAFNVMDEPDLVLVTDIHGDHMDASTLQALDLENTTIIVPQAVKDELPQELHGQLVVLNNGESREFNGFSIEAIPMYNLPESDDAFHTKGRGNGYIIERDGKRLYIAGDTEDIPEMRNLQNIDMALVPMNLPYTMDVDQAAEGVLAFEPKEVYPYHFRGEEGYADVERFKEIINERNENIEVVQLEWYPDRDE